MSVASNYTYTPEQVTAAFDEIKATLFSGIKVEAVPKILVVAGIEGAGKTYLLEKASCPQDVTTTMFVCICPNTEKNTLNTKK